MLPDHGCRVGEARLQKLHEGCLTQAAKLQLCMISVASFYVPVIPCHIVFEMMPITDVPNKRDLIQSFINFGLPELAHKN